MQAVSVYASRSHYVAAAPGLRRRHVEALRIEHRTIVHGRITASMGYCYADELDALTPQRLIEEADWALYLAKDGAVASRDYLSGATA